jgi:hypothetical protein
MSLVFGNGVSNDGLSVLAQSTIQRTSESPTDDKDFIEKLLYFTLPDLTTLEMRTVKVTMRTQCWTASRKTLRGLRHDEQMELDQSDDAKPIGT